MDAAKIRPFFLLAVVVAAAALAFLVFKPFLAPIALAAIFAVILNPLFARVSPLFGGHRGLASFATVLLATIIILIPFFFLTTLIVNQAISVYYSLGEGMGRVYFESLVGVLTSTFGAFMPGVEALEANIVAELDFYAQRAISSLISHLGPIVSSVTGFFVSLFVFFFALFYLLKDGWVLKRYIVALSPLADQDDEQIFAKIERAINAVIKGNLALALIQGAVSTLGYTIFGLPNSILWGTATAFAALIPGVGTSLVMIPAVLYLFFSGSGLSALGLLLWGMVAVGLIDNLLGPRLIGRGTLLHPLLVLLSVLGGLIFFGPSGIFLGPITISLLMALLSIYAADRSTT